MGLLSIWLLPMRQAHAQCGFNSVGDYICQGGAQAPGKTAPHGFPASEAQRSAQPQNTYTGAVGSSAGMSFSAYMRDLRAQMAAAEDELAYQLANPLQHGGGGASPCAGEEVVSVDFTSNWQNGLDFKHSPNTRGGGTGTGGHDINGNQCLRVTYPEGKAGDGYSFRVKMPPSDHYIQSYDVMFGEGLDFVKGGKLAGMFGGVGQTGGKVITDGSGFSTRVMWRKGGRAQAYVYHAEQPGTWGDGETTADPVFTPGQLHNVTVETIMNDPGIANGVMRIWVDGNLVVEETKYLFRYDNSLQIDAWGIGTIFGGSTPDFAPTKDEEIYFCNMRIMAGDTAQCNASQ